ncbi:MAG: nucleotide-binding protein, partial [Nitrospira sp.]|nr:nucleotide-binding protein [Nitrospira sp.]
LNPRARQNVIFEFGYFIGKLDRKRVCALIKGDVEKPSDYDGVLCIPWDDPDGWKMRLIKELKSAGFEVDANRAISS